MTTQLWMTRYGRRTGRPDDLLDVDELARSAGLHPDLARRLHSLGLLDAEAQARDEPLFSPAAAVRLRRMARLRRDLHLTWSGLGLVLDLLERIDVLEERLHASRGSARG